MDFNFCKQVICLAKIFSKHVFTRFVTRIVHKCKKSLGASAQNQITSLIFSLYDPFSFFKRVFLIRSASTLISKYFWYSPGVFSRTEQGFFLNLCCRFSLFSINHIFNLLMANERYKDFLKGHF